ncbi:hypothetical protein QEZ52_04865 [Aliisedimentitalea scapharcae]|uniref:Uncharacterized protein n=1 Tax=Aliisedimentitalea scapharcae TaxID=1524259 RepID=A0ABZ2XX43_9RHOB|nr:hypothetical protein K3727_04760 [Rhodobacteraceae bacterium M382]
MSFIRPEARAAIWRCRELIAGVGIGVLGVSWVVGTAGLIWWLGWVLVAIGAAGTIIGLQRLRFRIGVGGPGVVQVDEGQISYFGPLTGGAVALSELERLRLDHTATPAHWVLDMPGHPSLHIPVNAEGVDALFDAFTTLSGLRTERMLSELRKPGSHQVVIWERHASHTQVHRLH